jgi:outer membrane protein assembly factor BamB
MVMGHWRKTFISIALASAFVVTALTQISGLPSGTADAATSPNGASWTVYHGTAAGSGTSSTVKSINIANRAWTSPLLDGQLYGEPLAFSNEIYVASENDTVYDLSSKTGAIIWARHLARPVPSSALPCGDISPEVGITGTPVIDPSRNEIFVVADEFVNGHPHHRLVGLSTVSGTIELNRDVDPPGADPAALLQRTGLNLDDGRVVFGMGGNYGDCAAYRGRVVSVGESGSTPRFFTVDARAGDSQGAIWMGGAAPVVSSRGDVWVSVGNGSVYSSSQAYDDSDSVLELSPTMRLIQYFAPSTWPQNNSSDLDMSMAPVLLSSGQVLLAGKSRIVYLLNGNHLGGIGHEEASLASACSGDIDGGAVTVGSVVYIPCVNGTVAIRTSSSPASLRVLWTSPNGGGPPLVAGGLVWSIGQNGTLYGLNPATGAVRQHVEVGASANHFPTPSVGDGLLLIPLAYRVSAYSATPSS